MITTELNPGSTELVIAFTGFGGRLLIDVGRFMSEAGLSSASRVIVNDPDKAMCLGGVRGHCESFWALIQRLEKIYVDSAASTLIVVGASGGGHTALLAAHLLRADICTVFSPYPYLSPEEAEKLNDPIATGYPRLREFFSRLAPDLKALLNAKDTLANWNGKTRYFVHVAKHNVWDHKRARTIAHLPHLVVIEHPYGQHDVVKFILSKSGLRCCFMPNQKAFFDEIYANDKTPVPVSFNLKNDSEILLIAFSDHQENILIPAESLFKKMGVASESTIVVNDASRSACFLGAPGLGESITEVIASLQDISLNSRSKKIVVMGAYFGAHTALLAAHMLKADLCVTFSPFPNLKHPQNNGGGDAELKKFRGLVRRSNKAGQNTQRYLDLKEVLSSWNGKTEYIVHIPEKHQGDLQRAKAMASLPHTTIIRHPCGRGRLPRFLTDTKRISNLLLAPQAVSGVVRPALSE